MPKCANLPAPIDMFSKIFESRNNWPFWDKVNNPAGFPVNIRYPVILYTSQDK